MLGYAENGNFSLDLPDGSDGVVLRDARVTWGRASRADGDNGIELSPEEIGRLDDCDLLLYRADAKGAPANGLADGLKLPGWKHLPAVKAGHAYPITWNDVCSYRWAQLALNDFESKLDRAVRGVRPEGWAGSADRRVPGERRSARKDIPKLSGRLRPTPS